MIYIEIIYETRGDGACGRFLNGRVATTSKTTICLCTLAFMSFACCQCLVAGTHDERVRGNDWMLFAASFIICISQANILIFLSCRLLVPTTIETACLSPVLMAFFQDSVVSLLTHNMAILFLDLQILQRQQSLQHVEHFK